MIFSCGNDQNMKVDVSAKPFEWEKVYSHDSGFVAVLSKINTSNESEFINSETGLFIISSAGAIPGVQWMREPEGALPMDFSHVKEEELPKVDCDSKSFWSKAGCYVQKVNQINESKILENCNLSKGEKEKAERASQAIIYSAINTELSIRYYFSLIGGRWYITFIDARKPCQA